MTKLGRAIAERGAGIRSGNAIRADQAWESGAWGAGGAVESYTVKYKRGVDCIPLQDLPCNIVQQAREIAQQHYARWPRVDQYIRDLMARNVFQVLGRDLAHPSQALLCWAQDPVIDRGRIVDVTGGTGLAVRLASTHQIPVLNLHIKSHLDTAREWYVDHESPISDLVQRIRQEIPDGFVLST